MTPNRPAVPVIVNRSVEVPWDRIERFVGQLTHDVRNGLNALELQLTFLGEISTDPEAVEEVKRIRKTIGEITRQLQDVRNSTGAVTLNKLDYPATDFFEDLQERFERREPASKDRVQWQYACNGASLSIDPETTMAAFLELLGNAMHFADRTSSVMFTGSLGSDHAVVTLRESRAEAPAISSEDWGRTPLLSTRRSAYGLGLFRVVRIVEAQGGEFAVSYSLPDQLLMTTVTLPLSRHP